MHQLSAMKICKLRLVFRHFLKVILHSSQPYPSVSHNLQATNAKHDAKTGVTMRRLDQDLKSNSLYELKPGSILSRSWVL